MDVYKKIASISSELSGNNCPKSDKFESSAKLSNFAPLSSFLQDVVLLWYSIDWHLKKKVFIEWLKKRFP